MKEHHTIEMEAINPDTPKTRDWNNRITLALMNGLPADIETPDGAHIHVYRCGEDDDEGDEPCVSPLYVDPEDTAATFIICYDKPNLVSAMFVVKRVGIMQVKPGVENRDELLPPAADPTDNPQ